MQENEPQLASLKERKQSLLPQVAALDEEGRSYREIANTVGVPKSTIAVWLREARAKPAPEERPEDPPNPAEEIRRTIEFFKSMRQAAHDEWQLSKAARQVSVVEKSGPANDPAAKIKTSFRTESRTGNTAYFKAVMEAQDKIDELEERLAALQGLRASPADRLANLTDDDLENLSDEEMDNFDNDELYAMDLRLGAKREREGRKFDRPIFTNEQLSNMTDEERLRYRRPDPASLGAQAPAPTSRQPPPAAPEPPPCAAGQPNNPGAAPPPEAADANAAGSVAAIPAAVDLRRKGDPRPLAVILEIEARRRAEAEKKRKRKKWTDPVRNAYPFDGFRKG